MAELGLAARSLRGGGRALVFAELRALARSGTDVLAIAKSWGRRALAANNPAGALVALARGQRVSTWPAETARYIAQRLAEIPPRAEPSLEPRELSKRERVLAFIRDALPGATTRSARNKLRQLALAWR